MFQSLKRKNYSSQNYNKLLLVNNPTVAERELIQKNCVNYLYNSVVFDFFHVRIELKQLDHCDTNYMISIAYHLVIFVESA